MPSETFFRHRPFRPRTGPQVHACQNIYLHPLRLGHDRSLPDTSIGSEEEREGLRDNYVVEKNHEFLDLTDRENREFGYVV